MPNKGEKREIDYFFELGLTFKLRKHIFFKYSLIFQMDNQVLDIFSNFYNNF